MAPCTNQKKALPSPKSAPDAITKAPLPLLAKFKREPAYRAYVQPEEVSDFKGYRHRLSLTSDTHGAHPEDLEDRNTDGEVRCRTYRGDGDRRLRRDVR
jgi:hypothetical protein